jgi:hypothetical protein
VPLLRVEKIDIMDRRLPEGEYLKGPLKTQPLDNDDKAVTISPIQNES